MQPVRLSSKGQVVIPKQIRDQLGMKKGTLLRIAIQGDRIILEPLQASVQRTLYGKYRDSGLLGDLEAEHAEEMAEKSRP